jgi:hypothetical protein
MSAVLSVLQAYTNETFMAVAGPPMAPAQRDSGDSGSLRSPIDSDTARASTVQEAERPERSGVSVRSHGGAGARGKRRAALAVIGTSALGLAAVVAWQARTGPSPVASSPVLALTATAAPSVDRLAASVSPAPPPSAEQAASAAADAASPVARAIMRPAPSSTPRAVTVGTRTQSPPAPATASATHAPELARPTASGSAPPPRVAPSQSIDPASYQ